MITEAFMIGEEVKKVEGRKRTLHPNICPVPTQRAAWFTVFINAQGKCSGVAPTEQDTLKGGLYYFGDAHNQWPVVKVENKKNQSGEFYERWEEGIPRVNESHAQKMCIKIKRVSRIVADIVQGHNPPKAVGSVGIMADRMEKVDSAFVNDIFAKIFNSLSTDEERKLATKLMYLTFELEDYDKLKVNPVAHRKNYEFVSDCLIHETDRLCKDEDKGDKRDMFGRPYVSSAAWKMPQIFVGNKKYYIHSRNEKSLCYASYGRNGGDSCPLAFSSRKQVVETLQYLGLPEHKDIYWMTHIRKVSSKEQKGKRETVFTVVTMVYSPLPKEMMQELQRYIEIGGEVARLAQQGHENKTKTRSVEIIQALKGNREYKDNGLFYLFTFEIPSNGPSHLLLTQTMTIPQFLKQVERWTHGWDNFEPAKFNGELTVKKGETKPLYDSITAYQLLRVINNRWSRTAGIRDEKIQSRKRIEYQFMQVPDMIRLFFGDRVTVDRCLNVMANNHVFLLLDVVDRIHNGELYHLVGDNPRTDIFSLPVAIGELLYQKGITKEVYEQSPAYHFGRAMACLSRVQKAVLKRDDKKKPRRMVGTEYVHLGLARPRHALNLALTKGGIYLRRAKRDRMVEHSQIGESKSYYNYWALVRSLEVLKQGLPAKWTDTEKVIMALGYFNNR